MSSLESDADTPRIQPDDFARRFSLRSGNLMWLLGAGASASAGIPTAWDMIWEFKQQLYASQRKVSPKSIADFSNPALQRMLQAHLDASKTFPPMGDPLEYAALFEAVYPSEADRRAYIDAKVRGAKPSYGHLALATFMRAQKAPLVWTTNFDPLVADACAKVYDGTGALTIVQPESADVAQQAITSSRWPIEVKLHGDFRSRRLKNTSDELRHQDERLRRALVDASRRFGLIVAGYSGRDDSIMDALFDALSHPTPFPNGLFWFHRGDGPPLSRVATLLRQASTKGIDAGLVSVESFDEVMRDLIRLSAGVDTTQLDGFEGNRKRWTPPPSLQGKRHFPVLRFNALQVAEKPTVCRKVVCDIEGYAAVRDAVRRAGVDILVGRTRAGVLAFGSDVAVRAAFEPHNIQDFDLHTIASDRLYRETGERGLLRDALVRALARERALCVQRKGRADLMAPSVDKDAVWKPLQKIVGVLSGVVPGDPTLTWKEAVAVRLDWAADCLWLLMEPRTMFDGLTHENRALATDFARERTVRRYNRELNNLIAFWADRLSCAGGVLRALGIGDGVDAVFRLGTTTAFSKRVSA